MQIRSGKTWLVVGLVVWVVALAGAGWLARFVHRRSPAILDRLTATDPAPARRALRLRLEADRLVHGALVLHEAATSGSLADENRTTGTLVAEAAPLLEEAERLYLESLEAATSQPGVLFQLGEVNLLLGRRAGGYLFLARYWEATGEPALARAYRERARALDPATSISLPPDRATTAPTD